MLKCLTHSLFTAFRETIICSKWKYFFNVVYRSWLFQKTSFSEKKTTSLGLMHEVTKIKDLIFSYKIVNDRCNLERNIRLAGSGSLRWYPDNYFHFEVTNLFNDVLMSKTLLIFELLVQFWCMCFFFFLNKPQFMKLYGELNEISFSGVAHQSKNETSSGWKRKFSWNWTLWRSHRAKNRTIFNFIPRK